MDILNLSPFISSEITLASAAKFILIGVMACVAVTVVFRLLFGKNSALNRAIGISFGILSIYILTIVVYTFFPARLGGLLSPLPFVKFSGEYMYLMSFTDSDFTLICSQAMSMVILVLLYNLADSILPEGKSAISWFILRFLTIVTAMIIHYYVTDLTESFLPDLLTAYGPTILLVCLIASLLMGAISVILGLVLAVVNPIFGILFSFFFSNKFGKQISKAMLTTALLCILVALLNHFGCSIISISPAALPSYIPLLALLLALWYLIRRKL